MVAKWPRNYLLMLQTIVEIIEDADEDPKGGANPLATMSSRQLLNRYNQMARALSIDRVTLGDVHDILVTFEQSDILQYVSKQRNCKVDTRKSSVVSATLTPNKSEIHV